MVNKCIVIELKAASYLQKAYAIIKIPTFKLR